MLYKDHKLQKIYKKGFIEVNGREKETIWLMTVNLT